MADAERILTTHVGSLVRPDELVTFLRAKAEGRAYDEAAYQDCLARSVADVVAHQARLGIDIVSDGEFGKQISWSRYVLERLSGFEQREDAGRGLKEGEIVFGGRDRAMFPEFYAEYDKTQGMVGRIDNWVCSGPIRYIGQDALQRDIDNLKAAMQAAGATEGFLPVVAPASVVPMRKDEHYASDRDYVFAVAEALRVEYRAIVDAGLIAQIDDAYTGMWLDLLPADQGIKEYRDWAAMRIDALNHALEGIPRERTRYHLCWGSWNAPHISDVPLKDVVDLVLRLNVGGYSFEAANPRHEHEWRLWETVKLPPGTKLLPGLVAHSTNVVEHPELVAERITRLARLVGRENVVASTDCGFAQGPFTRRVHPSVMWAKLDSLVAGARLATQELWGRRAA
jgi:5-methyltetrahydropteroyltriglutamate--homocysteine methyltransferase